MDGCVAQGHQASHPGHAQSTYRHEGPQADIDIPGLEIDADAKEQVAHQPHGLDGARVLHVQAQDRHTMQCRPQPVDDHGQNDEKPRHGCTSRQRRLHGRRQRPQCHDTQGAIDHGLQVGLPLPPGK